ncbi:Alb1 domain-containing protein [Aspergillus candidus]|uniref:Alb1-domain-containing protein n=1 Tax=Aspergillus candidus TaxID=41067 RepID=A0A2I2F870_ASPCN|nr:Alb1-domain-containing protein [Aspergillus candidus]PLB36834.1 Alb1-domain-containing protein [Aspergillus candidus]
MAKVRNQSVRSRAARRQASPSLDVDKSLKSLPRAEDTPVSRESVLTDRRNSGIMKKQKGKALTRAQKQRQMKGVERAEAVIDQMEIKVTRSSTRAKTIKARSADWDDLNKKSKGSVFQALNDAEGDVEDEGDGDAMVDDSGAPAPAATDAPAKPAAKPVFATQNPAVADHADNDEDEEIT